MIHNDSTPILRHPRTLGLIAFAVCTGLLGTAFYMEYVWYLEPCPLCMAQRVAFALFGLIGLIAALTPPTAARVRAFAIAGTLAAGFGLYLAGRQLWLQSLPPDQVPDCAPGIYYMIDTFPFAEVVQTMLMGSGDCAEVQWRWLGLSIPGWTAVAFGIMTLLAASTPFWVRYRPRLFR